MPRIAVAAEKDPRATVRPRADREDWAASIPGLARHEAETLAAVAMTLCPHDWLDVMAYHDAVAGLMTDVAGHQEQLAILRDGLAGLDAVFPQPFIALSAGNRAKALARREGTAFFKLCLAGTTRNLYDLPEVWAGCGYEGAHGCKDGVIRSDIDDPVEPRA